jgi:hypothetical protein
MDQMLIGAIAATSLAAGLFFFRFWRTTHDRFFLLFAISFWIEGANRVMLYEFVGLDDDAPVYYLIRLLAYGLILVAIIDKNRGPRRRE